MDKSQKKSETLSLAELRYMFAALSVDLILFTDAARRMESSTFHSSQEAYKIYWEQLVVYKTRWGRLPNKDELRQDIVAYLDDVDLSDEDVELAIEEVLDLIPTINPDEADSRRDKVRKFLRIFLDFSASQKLTDQLSEGVDAKQAIKTTQEEMQLNSSIEGGQGKDWFASMDEIIQDAHIVRFPTGVWVVDEMMNGGPSGGEVTLHMGAVNSGKTTLAVQLGVSRAKIIAQMKKKDAIEATRKVYFYVYEEARQVFIAILARASEVAYPSMREFLTSQDPSVLSTSKKKNYKPYEKRYRSIRKHGVMDGEWERLQRARTMLSENMRFISMSSEDRANTDRSGEYVDGLVDHFESDMLQTNTTPDLTIIDHASAMVERYMAEGGRKQDERRHLLKSLAMHLRDRIAAPYRMPIWCLHQLDSSENKRPAGSVPDVASGSECKMMHEFFSFSFQSSRVTEGDKIGVIAMGKQRGMSGSRPRPFRIDGDMCRWVDAQSTHIIHGDRVRALEDVEALGVVGKTKTPRAAATMAAFSPRKRSITVRDDK